MIYISKNLFNFRIYLLLDKKYRINYKKEQHNKNKNKNKKSQINKIVSNQLNNQIYYI